MNTGYENVLVLNRLWQAVNTCSWERAATLLYCDLAEVVHEAEGVFCTYNFEDWCTFSETQGLRNARHSISLAFSTPRIILLKCFDRYPRKEVKFTRINIFERDEFTCQYCEISPERKHLNIDHVVPKSRGGKTIWENVVCSCVDCNSRKGDRTPEEARMHLPRKPYKPTWRPFIRNRKVSQPDQSWERFLA